MSSVKNTKHRPRLLLPSAALAILLVTMALSISSSAQEAAEEFVDTASSIPEALSDLGATVFDFLELTQWEAALNDLLNDPCSDLPVVFITAPEPGWCLNRGSGGSISNILANATGPMGIPNPNTARQEIERGIKESDTAPDVFEINPEVYALQAGNLSDRVLTRQAIESLLGKQGQEEMKQELQVTQQVIKQNEQRASEAQELDVTQDIFKLFIQNDANTSALTAGVRSDLARLRVDTQFTNLNLVNISRTLDEEARHERVEQAARSAKILTFSAQAGLLGQ